MSMIMGRHKEWRKIAKKERRKRIRVIKAALRTQRFEKDNFLINDQTWLKEQEQLEMFDIEEIGRQNMIVHENWLRAEKIANVKWKMLQEKIELQRLKHLEDEIKVQKEWEYEQHRVKEAQEKLKKMTEENTKRQQLFMEKLEHFLSGNSDDPPEELLVCKETKPGVEKCPFFVKTACCRFGDLCSRNHIYPGISKVLMAQNFHSHFGLENSFASEYEDAMLEYEDSETYKNFKEFFYDVVPEFEKYGEVIQFKVCYNYERHLRGNTYIEFSDIRSAVSAYRALHSRWYAGKQLSLQFCNISSWKGAICGLQMRNRCPKGRTCNFLHVFINPVRLNKHKKIIKEDNYDSTQHRPRTWRWSESPEREPSYHRRTRKDDLDKHHNKRKRDKSLQLERSPNSHEQEKRDRRRSRRDDKDNHYHKYKSDRGPQQEMSRNFSENSDRGTSRRDSRDKNVKDKSNKSLQQSPKTKTKRHKNCRKEKHESIIQLCSL